MKRAVTAIVTALAVTIMGILPSFAAIDETYQYKLMTTEQLAYCDIHSAPAEVQADILEARDAIIHSTSWTVDGQAEICHPDGTIEKLPEFSELFPDWDIPTVPDAENDIMPYSLSYDGFVYLQHPTSTVTPPFYAGSAGATGITIVVRAISLPGSSWNCAIDRLGSGSRQEVSFARDMGVGSRLQYSNTRGGVNYAVRASTYSTEGYAQMSVYEMI